MIRLLTRKCVPLITVAVICFLNNACKKIESDFLFDPSRYNYVPPPPPPPPPPPDGELVITSPDDHKNIQMTFYGQPFATKIKAYKVFKRMSMGEQDVEAPDYDWGRTERQPPVIQPSGRFSHSMEFAILLGNIPSGASAGNAPNILYLRLPFDQTGKLFGKYQVKNNQKMQGTGPGDYFNIRFLASDIPQEREKFKPDFLKMAFEYELGENDYWGSFPESKYNYAQNKYSFTLDLDIIEHNETTHTIKGVINDLTIELKTDPSKTFSVKSGSFDIDYDHFETSIVKAGSTDTTKFEKEVQEFGVWQNAVTMYNQSLLVGKEGLSNIHQFDLYSMQSNDNTMLSMSGLNGPLSDSGWVPRFSGPGGYTFKVGCFKTEHPGIGNISQFEDAERQIKSKNLLVIQQFNTDAFIKGYYYFEGKPAVETRSSGGAFLGYEYLPDAKIYWCQGSFSIRNIYKVYQ